VRSFWLAFEPLQACMPLTPKTILVLQDLVLQNLNIHDGVSL
jgi:hypothetical protein